METNEKWNEGHEMVMERVMVVTGYMIELCSNEYRVAFSAPKMYINMKCIIRNGRAF